MTFAPSVDSFQMFFYYLSFNLQVDGKRLITQNALHADALCVLLLLLLLLYKEI